VFVLVDDRCIVSAILHYLSSTALQLPPVAAVAARRRRMLARRGRTSHSWRRRRSCIAHVTDVVRHNRLTRSDGFLTFGSVAFPRMTDALSRLIDASGCVFMALIAWIMFPEFVESIETCHFLTAPEFGPPPSGDFLTDIAAAFGRCEYFGTPGIFTAPWWPAKLAIVFSVSLCSVIFLFKAILGRELNSNGELTK